jgi:hypothetical protein
MKFVELTKIGLCLVASSALVAAQDTGGQDKPEARPVPAAAPIEKSDVQVEVAVPVTGLTEENAAKVESALEGLKATLYTCAGCKGEFAKAGACPACKSGLTSKTEPVIEQVTVAADQGKVTVKTHEGMQLKLSEIERALATSGVKVDDQKMNITGDATIVVAGVTNAEQAKAVGKALEESKLFQRVAAPSSAPAGQQGMIQVSAGSTGASRAKVNEAIAKVAPTHKVQDVVWNSWEKTGA